jgi:hypothetical protein
VQHGNPLDLVVSMGLDVCSRIRKTRAKGYSWAIDDASPALPSSSSSSYRKKSAIIHVTLSRVELIDAVSLESSAPRSSQPRQFSGWEACLLSSVLPMVAGAAV